MSHHCKKPVRLNAYQPDDFKPLRKPRNEFSSHNVHFGVVILNGLLIPSTLFLKNLYQVLLFGATLISIQLQKRADSTTEVKDPYTKKRDKNWSQLSPPHWFLSPVTLLPILLALQEKHFSGQVLRSATISIFLILL